MDKASRYKSKNPKKAPAKQKSAKKRKSEGPTCSMFLAELTRKLANRKKQDEETPKNIVQTIIESITNALPVKFSRRPSRDQEPQKQIEPIQNLAPELVPNDTLEIPVIVIKSENTVGPEFEISSSKLGFKIPRMPIVNSDLLKEKKKKITTDDASVNTSGEHDISNEIKKHVDTLRKISLIAEEFNQKTAKNLKEIVDSVQEDLLKKLEELQKEKKASQPSTSAVDQPMEISKD